MTCTGWNSDPLEDTSISQITANVTLFGKRVFADVIKDRKMRSSKLIQVGPKSINECPLRHIEKRGQKEEKPGDDGGRDGSDATAR